MASLPYPRSLLSITLWVCGYGRDAIASYAPYSRPLPWQFLNFLPLPQGHGSLRPGSLSLTSGVWFSSMFSRVSWLAAACCAGSLSSAFCSVYCWRCVRSSGAASRTSCCCCISGICPRVRIEAMRLFMSFTIESKSLALSSLKMSNGSFCS